MSKPSAGPSGSRWLFWSTRDSINEGVPSVMAIIETALAIPIYWWIAVQFETYLLLLIAVAAAPLVLLRSDESVALGVKWFRTWEDDEWSEKRNHFQPSERSEFVLAMVRATILVGATSGSVAFIMAKIFLEDAVGWMAFWCGAVLGSASAVAGLAAMAVGGLYRMGASTTVAATGGTTAAAAAVVGLVVQAGSQFPPLLSEKLGFVVGAALGGFLFSVGVFVLTITLIIRIAATVRYIPAGVRSLPRNFRRLILCTSPTQEPELVPGLMQGTTLFTLPDLLNLFQIRLRGSYDNKIFAISMLPLTMLLLVHAWLALSCYFEIDRMVLVAFSIPWRRLNSRKTSRDSSLGRVGKSVGENEHRSINWNDYSFLGD